MTFDLPTGVAHLEFVSDHSVSGLGFLATWEAFHLRDGAACKNDSVIGNAEGQIGIPGFESPRDNREVTYR